MVAAETEKAVGKVINIGSGREISIGQLAQVIGSTVGHPVTIKLDEKRLRPGKSEVIRLLADNRLAKEILNWEPCVSIEKGIKLTITWIAAHLNRYQLGEYQI
jgi:dTDP-glucose 4,6-dehydratase